MTPTDAEHLLKRIRYQFMEEIAKGGLGIQEVGMKLKLEDLEKALSLTKRAINEGIDESTWISGLEQLHLLDPQTLEVIRRPAKGAHGKDVFVVISFAREMEPIFEGIRAAGESCGLRVRRVKDVLGDYRITDKIIEMITDARFIVADLTHERPNVYFELGFARGLGKTVITTAKEGTDVHFDVKDWTCIFYNDSRVLERSLQTSFQALLAQEPGQL